MRDVLDQVLEWIESGERVALATVVDVVPKAPRDPGAALAVTLDGRVAGSVSGGCVEPAVVEEAQQVLRTGDPRLLTFGISDDQAFEVGLSCGGTIRVLVEMADRTFLRAVAQAIRDRRAAALVTVLPGDGSRSVAPGTKIFVPEDPDEPASGSTGRPSLDRELAGEARRMLARDQTGSRVVAGVEVFVHSFAPPPVLYVIGAVHPAPALAAAGKFLGFRVVVCDPRAPFATAERLPAADEIVRRWPDEYLAGVGLTPRDAVCVLTHDLKFDVPAIRAALESPVGYLGVMGSRRTHARRMAALREAGVSEDQLARLHAPIGLEIGARTPEEMAVAIMAEIVAARRLGSSRAAAAS